jgi:hypothetical protein
LLAAVVVVAGVIGISGIYPQVIDAEWVPDGATRLPVMSLSNPKARTRALGGVTPLESSSRRVATTGQGMVSPPRPTPTPEATQPQRATAEALEPAPEAAVRLAIAEVLVAQTKADVLPVEASPAPTTKVAEKPPTTRVVQKPPPTRVVEKPKPVVKKKVVRVAHRRSFHGAYAQYNGGAGGGWGGGYRF